MLAEACEKEKTYGPLIMPVELTAELSRRQKEFTIIGHSLECLSDYVTGKLWVAPQYAFQKDELFKVMGVTKPTSKDGQLLAQVTREDGLTEVKRGPKEKRIRYFVREKAAETENASILTLLKILPGHRTLGHKRLCWRRNRNLRGLRSRSASVDSASLTKHVLRHPDTRTQAAALAANNAASKPSSLTFVN